MDSKIGGFILLFIGIIVALTLYTGGITQNIGDVTLKKVVVNQTITFPANTSSAYVVLNGKVVSDVIITNVTVTTVVPSTNYSIVNNALSSTTGALEARLYGTKVPGTPDGNNKYAGNSVNISYTYEPLTYASDSGSRGMVGLIAIFAALALIGFVIYKVYEDSGYIFGK